MKITVTSNVSAIIADLQAAGNLMPAAVVRALNKVAEQVKTATSREIRAAGYNLKASTIKKGIRIVRASEGQLSANVIASGRPIPLIEFAARDVKPRGVSVNVLNGRKVIKNAFIVTMPNGHRAVCIRSPDAKGKKVMRNGKPVWTTLPIRQLYGPALPDALANKAVERAMRDLIDKKFPVILAHENEWLRKKVKP